MRVKVCGIRNCSDADIAIKAGADALGFLVGITHLAEDKIGNEEAKKIIEKMPPFLSSVMVTHLTDKKEIIDLANYLNVTTVQIHDYISAEDVKYVREKLPKCKIIKAIHIIDEDSSFKMLKEFDSTCDALLLDSRTEDRLGGTGKVHDWNVSKKIVAAARIPIILAGGLDENNVAMSVLKTRPYGVDANSGIELNGWKDFDKISNFVNNAKQAEREYLLNPTY